MSSAGQSSAEQPHGRWTLSIVTGAAICFGLLLVLAPGMASTLFGVLVFGPSGFPSEFGDEALAYVRLAHAVIGAVMVGWCSGWAACHWPTATRRPGRRSHCQSEAGSFSIAPSPCSRATGRTQHSTACSAARSSQAWPPPARVEGTESKQFR